MKTLKELEKSLLVEELTLVCRNDTNLLEYFDSLTANKLILDIDVPLLETVERYRKTHKIKLLVTKDQKKIFEDMADEHGISDDIEIQEITVMPSLIDYREVSVNVGIERLTELASELEVDYSNFNNIQELLYYMFMYYKDDIDILLYIYDVVTEYDIYINDMFLPPLLLDLHNIENEEDLQVVLSDPEETIDGSEESFTGDPELDEFTDEEFDEFDVSSLNEVLSRQARMKLKYRFMRSKAKRLRSLKRNLHKKVNTQTINSRARRLAVNTFKNKLLRGKDQSTLSISEKERVERMVQKRRKVISRIASRLINRVRKTENNRLKGGSK